MINVLKHAETDTNKANTLNILAKSLEYSDPRKSYEFIGESILLCEKLDYKKGLAKAYLNKGNYYFHKSEYNTALEAYNSALLTSRSINSLNGMASAYTGIGLVNTYIGDFKKAIENYFKGLEIKEQLGNLEGQAILLSNIGELYMYQKQYENSLKYHNKSIEIEKKLNNLQGMAESYSNIAAIYFYMQKQNLALDFYNLAIDLSKKLGDKALLARNLNNIGSIYQDKNENVKAIEFLQQSLKLREEIGDKNGLASSYQALGISYKKLNKPTEAIKYTETSIKISSEINAKRTLMESYNLLAELYEMTKKYDQALIYFHKAQQLNDTIETEDLSKSIVEIETKYQTDKKEKEIKLLTQQNQIQDLELNKNRITIYATITVILLLAGLAATILKRYQLKQKANKIISEQKALVELKQKEIVDSINYAKRIQYTLIAHNDFLTANLKDHFALYMPKDIVSGDFYWATKKDNRFYLAVCDSTGHGVPGAFMSLLNIGFLSEAINEKNIIQPNEILNYVRERLIDNISKEGQKDGFDGVLICYDRNNRRITYSSAYNNPVLIRNGQLNELPADKMPVGKGEKDASFSLHTINVMEGDMLYLFTDGYADQFGGPQGKKFKYKQLNELLSKIAHLNSNEQHSILSNTIEEWKGNLEQIDDICLFGIRF